MLNSTNVIPQQCRVSSASICPNNINSQSELTKRLDDIICQFLVEQNVPGATLAVAKHGCIVYEQGYGVAGAGRRMKADMALRVASISKPVTAIAALRLCQDGKLSIDDKVFGAKGILKHLKTRGDKRLSLVTVRHLLQHSAGWDRDQAGDAVFFKVPPPFGMEITSSQYNGHLLQYVLNRKLQFTPGTRHVYSNLGYLVLGEVIEAVTGKTYESYVTSLLAQIGITDMYVGREERAYWQSVEGEYFNIKEPMTMVSLMPGQEDSSVLPQYGSFLMRNTGAFGGWVTTARDLLHILHSLEVDCGLQSSHCLNTDKDGVLTQVSNTTVQRTWSHGLLDPSSVQIMLERPSYESGRDWYGLGLDVQDGGKTWGHTGAMEGTCATMQQHHSGLSWAFILNAWASDMDLDGVVKFALSSIQYLSPFPHALAETCGKVLRVTTQDEHQCIVVHLPLHGFLSEIDEKHLNGFEPVWLGVNTAGQEGDMKPSFNIIFSRDKEPSARKTVLGIEVSQLSTVLQEYSKEGFQPELITTYENSGTLYGMALLSQTPHCCVQVDVCVPAQEYVLLLNERKKSGFHVVSQCVSHCRHSGQLVVTAIMERKSKSLSRNQHLKAGDCTSDCEGNGATRMKKSGHLETDECGHLDTDRVGQEHTEYLAIGKDDHLKTKGSGILKTEQFKTNDIEHSSPFKTKDHKYFKTENLTAEDSGFFETDDNVDLKAEDNDLITNDSEYFERERIGQGGDTSATNRKRKLPCSSAEDNLSSLHHSISSQASECSDMPSVTKKTECENCEKLTPKRISSPRKAGRKHIFGRKQTLTTRLKRLSWVQMPVDSFVTEMGRQAKHRCGLQNIHFYPEDTKWFVSGVWSPHCTHNCYHRLGVSQLGLLPALAEAAARNVYLRFLCQYEEEGVTYYALFWQAPQFGESV